MKSISIVIPAKDEQERLPHFLRTVIDFCRKSSHSYEIIVVDDGSKDRTVETTVSFQKEFPSLKVVSLERNYGKGYAVKQGLLAAKGEIVLFLDADGSTQPQEIERHLDWFEQGYDIVIGSRVLIDGRSQVRALAYRKLMGSIFNFLVSHLLIKGIKDTQCGFKMFRAAVIKELFGPLHLDGYGFDLEILYLAQKKDFHIKEVAVNWAHVDGSKVDLLKDSLGMFWNIIQIRFLFKYDRDTQVPGQRMDASPKDEQLIALSSMSLGQRAVIVALLIETEQGGLIQKMGVLPGEILEVVRWSPQRDKIEIKIRGYFISLLKEQADHIMVKSVTASPGS